MEKLSSSGLYNMQLIFKTEKPTAEVYLHFFLYIYIYIYILPTRVTVNVNTDLCMLQYKLIHNVLYLNKMI